MSGVLVSHFSTLKGNLPCGISVESQVIAKMLNEIVERSLLLASRQNIPSKFYDLMRTWKKETLLLSSITKIATHPGYQRIIGMGMDAVPLILREFEREPNHWSWALSSITGENPVAPEDRGNLMRIRETWLNWGREHGYI